MLFHMDKIRIPRKSNLIYPSLAKLTSHWSHIKNRHLLCYRFHFSGNAPVFKHRAAKYCRNQFIYGINSQWFPFYFALHWHCSSCIFNLNCVLCFNPLFLNAISFGNSLWILHIQILTNARLITKITSPLAFL